MVTRILTTLCICILILGNTAFAQEEVDAVYLHNGSKILGTIVEMVPDSHVKIRMYDGSEMKYTVDRIEKVRKEMREMDSDGVVVEGENIVWYTEAADEEESPLLRTPYWELGAALGTPSGINLSAGYWFGVLGTRVSGGFFGDDFIGIQGNLGIKLHDDYTHSSVIAAVAGWSEMLPNRDEKYYGVVYELNYRGLFLQCGFAVGDRGHPYFMGQVGYMYRFLSD